MQKRVARRPQPRATVVEIQPRQTAFAQYLAEVPVLPETILKMDLAVQERCPDLRVMAELVLSDLGATVQILRLAVELYGVAPGCPTRIEDCISLLGANGCMEAMAAVPAVHDSRFDAITETWAHAREVAHHARLLAESESDVNPDVAYLVGLLHAVGMLPTVLGWPGGNRPLFDPAHAGWQMARQRQLPQPVIDFFRETHLSASCGGWAAIVQKAHRLAHRSCSVCPLERGARPLLYRAV